MSQPWSHRALSLRCSLEGLLASQTSLKRNDVQPSRLTMEGAPQEFQKDDILVYTQHLDKHVFGTTGSEQQLPGTVYAHHSVDAKLSAWNAASNSQLLLLAGPIKTHLPSSMAIAATSVIDSAIHLKVPYLAFYCQRPNDGTEIKSSSPEWAVTTGLVYSLIRQLLCKRLVPAEILDGPDFCPERFEALDGTDASLEPAVSILDTLLDHAGPHLLCIIDGLQI